MWPPPWNAFGQVSHALHGAPMFEPPPPRVDAPSSNVTIKTEFSSKDGEFRIFGTSRRKNASNCPSGPGGLGRQLSWPSSHMLGTMKLKRGTSPEASAASNADVSFGASALPIPTTLSWHSCDTGSPHSPPEGITTSS